MDALWTSRKLSVRSFPGVFGVADHESGDRLALRLSLPGAIHQFGEKTPIFEVISVWTRSKLSVCSFSEVFQVADHDSGYRFALKLHLPGAIDRFDRKNRLFWGELVIFHLRFRGRGRLALGYKSPSKSITTKKRVHGNRIASDRIRADFRWGIEYKRTTTARYSLL